MRSRYRKTIYAISKKRRPNPRGPIRVDGTHKQRLCTLITPFKAPTSDRHEQRPVALSSFMHARYIRTHVLESRSRATDHRIQFCWMHATFSFTVRKTCPKKQIETGGIKRSWWAMAYVDFHRFLCTRAAIRKADCTHKATCTRTLDSMLQFCEFRVGAGES